MYSVNEMMMYNAAVPDNPNDTNLPPLTKSNATVAAAAVTGAPMSAGSAVAEAIATLASGNAAHANRWRAQGAVPTMATAGIGVLPAKANGGNCGENVKERWPDKTRDLDDAASIARQAGRSLECLRRSFRCNERCS
mmetsp:Transcript_96409/g.241710  ORF Transcript_96409/g.241710 Transcript_96409/m.241710 type:complete len:137 (+) Transcript_96409:604-1014(+)